MVKGGNRQSACSNTFVSQPFLEFQNFRLCRLVILLVSLSMGLTLSSDLKHLPIAMTPWESQSPYPFISSSRDHIHPISKSNHLRHKTTSQLYPRPVTPNIRHSVSPYATPYPRSDLTSRSHSLSTKSHVHYSVTSQTHPFHVPPCLRHGITSQTYSLLIIPRIEYLTKTQPVVHHQFQPGDKEREDESLRIENLNRKTELEHKKDVDMDYVKTSVYNEWLKHNINVHQSSDKNLTYRRFPLVLVHNPNCQISFRFQSNVDHDTTTNKANHQAHQSSLFTNRKRHQVRSVYKYVAAANLRLQQNSKANHTFEVFPFPLMLYINDWSGETQCLISRCVNNANTNTQTTNVHHFQIPAKFLKSQHICHTCMASVISPANKSITRQYSVYDIVCVNRKTDNNVCNELLVSRDQRKRQGSSHPQNFTSIILDTLDYPRLLNSQSGHHVLQSILKSGTLFIYYPIDHIDSNIRHHGNHVISTTTDQVTSTIHSYASSINHNFKDYLRSRFHQYIIKNVTQRHIRKTTVYPSPSNQLYSNNHVKHKVTPKHVHGRQAHHSKFNTYNNHDKNYPHYPIIHLSLSFNQNFLKLNQNARGMQIFISKRSEFKKQQKKIALSRSSQNTSLTTNFKSHSLGPSKYQVVLRSRDHSLGSAGYPPTPTTIYDVYPWTRHSQRQRQRRRRHLQEDEIQTNHKLDFGKRFYLQIPHWPFYNLRKPNFQLQQKQKHFGYNINKIHHTSKKQKQQQNILQHQQNFQKKHRRQRDSYHQRMNQDKKIINQRQYSHCPFHHRDHCRHHRHNRHRHRRRYHQKNPPHRQQPHFYPSHRYFKYKYQHLGMSPQHTGRHQIPNKAYIDQDSTRGRSFHEMALPVFPYGQGHVNHLHGRQKGKIYHRIKNISWKGHRKGRKTNSRWRHGKRRENQRRDNQRYGKQREDNDIRGSHRRYSQTQSKQRYRSHIRDSRRRHNHKRESQSRVNHIRNSQLREYHVRESKRRDNHIRDDQGRDNHIRDSQRHLNHIRGSQICGNHESKSQTRDYLRHGNQRRKIPRRGKQRPRHDKPIRHNQKQHNQKRDNQRHNDQRRHSGFRYIWNMRTNSTRRDKHSAFLLNNDKIREGRKSLLENYLKTSRLFTTGTKIQREFNVSKTLTRDDARNQVKNPVSAIDFKLTLLRRGILFMKYRENLKQNRIVKLHRQSLKHDTVREYRRGRGNVTPHYQDRVATAMTMATTMMTKMTMTAESTPGPKDPNQERTISTSGPLEMWQEDCGVAAVPFIVGGQRSRPGRWPWQVSLQIIPSLTPWHRCGGVLVHPRWILTAAHCVEGEFYGNKHNWRIVLVDDDLDIESGQEKYRSITRIVSHPDYRRASNFPNDVALLKMDSPVDLRTGTLKTACLPRQQQGVEEEGGDQCWISGWGESRDKLKVTNTMREVPIEIVGLSQCQAMWSRVDIDVLDSQLCGGYGQTGACYGDSGGPLMCEREGRYHVTGVMSWLISNCSAHNFPNVFSRVTSFIPWIQGQINT